MIDPKKTAVTSSTQTTQPASTTTTPMKGKGNSSHSDSTSTLQSLKAQGKSLSEKSISGLKKVTDKVKHSELGKSAQSFLTSKKEKDEGQTQISKKFLKENADKLTKTDQTSSTPAPATSNPVESAEAPRVAVLSIPEEAPPVDESTNQPKGTGEQPVAARSWTQMIKDGFSYVATKIKNFFSWIFCIKSS